MQPAEPIFTVELYPGLSVELLGMLKSLERAEWNRPTACSGWSVKDVAAHLLGGNLGRLSFGRDRLAEAGSPASPRTNAELIALINRQNATWVDAARNISASLLVDFLDVTEPQVYRYFASLPPFEPAGIGVAWAGEQRSARWFDIAREYTEKWLHQQHIREAAGRPVLSERKWLHPVLDTFLRALPYTYRDVAAAEGTAMWVRVTGAAGGDWSLQRLDGGWRLFRGVAPGAVAAVRLDQDTAWRLASKGMSREEALARVEMEGDTKVAGWILNLVAIMA